MEDKLVRLDVNFFEQSIYVDIFKFKESPDSFYTLWQ